GRDREGRRILVADSAYFVEEPRSRSVAYCLAPVICLSILGTGWLFVLGVFRRRAGPTPSAAWPLCTTLSLFALPRLFFAAAGLIPHPGAFSVLALLSPLGRRAPLVRALQWLPLPGSIIGNLHRLVFAVPACVTTAYLTAYGIIGIRLWSY